MRNNKNNKANKNSKKTVKKTTVNVAVASKATPKAASVKTTPKPKAADITPNKPAAKDASKPGHKAKKPVKRGLIAGIIIAVVLLVSAAGLGVFFANKNNNPEPEEEEIAVIEEEPEEEPEEEEEELPTENTDPLTPEPTITDNAGYQVAAYKPRYISIPNIGLYNIPIVEIGADGSDRLGAPLNPSIVGWFYRSAIPGQQGVAMMDGHGGDLGIGIFKTLPRVAVGTDIIITMGDGRQFVYTIVEKVYKDRGVAADDYMSTADDPVYPGVPGITLITCTGVWIREEQTYTQRLFVRGALK